MSNSLDLPQTPPRGHGLYCNRTLNMRAIKAIGYDMDYTLIHYDVEAWERHAYVHLRDKLCDAGFGEVVGELAFDPAMAIRGLIVDTEQGNLVKANRFGYVKQASHGTERLSFDRLRRTYRQPLELSSTGRFIYLDTLFALSEACMYSQLVDLHDQGQLNFRGLTYADIYRAVRQHLDAAHAEGDLKAGVLADPARFVVLDPCTAQTLLDQRAAGKKLLLITNSEWSYTQAIMQYAFDRYLPDGMGWRAMFDLVIVSSRKPSFWHASNPLFEIVDVERGLLHPCVNSFGESGYNLGGNAALVERELGLSGDQILYVGDHIYADIYTPKGNNRWRTALVVRELEDEVDALEAFAPQQLQLSQLMASKEQLELAQAQHEVLLARAEARDDALVRKVGALRARIADLDRQIMPLAQAAGAISNERWGPLMRTGNDKSYFARQIERYADVYTSRVSNFGYATPYRVVRSTRGSLPHDLGPYYTPPDLPELISDDA